MTTWSWLYVPLGLGESDERLVSAADMPARYPWSAAAAELGACPECGLPAEITDRFSLPSTDGPVEHVAVACLSGHHFRMGSGQLPDQQHAGRAHDPATDLAAPHRATAERPPVAAAAGNSAAGGQHDAALGGAGDLAARHARVTTLAGAGPRVWYVGPAGCEDTEAPRN
jgi:hypothetical protein